MRPQPDLRKLMIALLPGDQHRDQSLSGGPAHSACRRGTPSRRRTATVPMSCSIAVSVNAFVAVQHTGSIAVGVFDDGAASAAPVPPRASWTAHGGDRGEGCAHGSRLLEQQTSSAAPRLPPMSLLRSRFEAYGLVRAQSCPARSGIHKERVRNRTISPR
jgi:hypothetical protein